MTLDIYPDIVKKEDLSPDHTDWDVDDLCQQIRDATQVG